MGPEKKAGRDSEPQSFDLIHHETLEELRTLSDAELERRHDAVLRALSDGHMSGSSAQQSQRYIERAHAYRAVLAQRQNERQAERMEALTRSMNRLSWVVVLATIAGVGTTVWALLLGGGLGVHFFFTGCALLERTSENS
jgi:hypothetical protein